MSYWYRFRLWLASVVAPRDRVLVYNQCLYATDRNLEALQIFIGASGHLNDGREMTRNCRKKLGRHFDSVKDSWLDTLETAV